MNDEINAVQRAREALSAWEKLWNGHASAAGLAQQEMANALQGLLAVEAPVLTEEEREDVDDIRRRWLGVEGCDADAVRLLAIIDRLAPPPYVARRPPVDDMLRRHLKAEELVWLESAETKDERDEAYWSIIHRLCAKLDAADAQGEAKRLRGIGWHECLNAIEADLGCTMCQDWREIYPRPEVPHGGDK